jgi:ATP-dependent RNA helicase DOB1
MRLYAQRQELEAQITTINAELKNATNDVVLRQTLKGMKRVLRRLGFTTRDNVIDLKGRVACEISTGDELLAVELMFSGMFNDLKPETLVAICSVLVYEEKNDEKVRFHFLSFSLLTSPPPSPPSSPPPFI